MAILKGTSRNDTLKDTSTKGITDLYGYAGDDLLYGQSGVDYLLGGDGQDKLYGGSGDDWLFGGNGADRLDGGSGFDGASYYDTTGVTVALDRSFKARGQAVGDTFVSIENLAGSNRGADALAGNANANRIYGNGGNDKIWGRKGADTLFGGPGNDRIYGESGDDWVIGNKGADYLNGGAGIDGVSYVDAPTGVSVSLDKSLSASGEATGDVFVSVEMLEGSNHDDLLAGNAGDNIIWGHKGNDTIYGRDGDDEILGGAGTNTLLGEGGDDWLNSDLGTDILYGGEGEDGVIYFYSRGLTVSLDGSLVATGAAVGDTFNSIEKINGSNTGSDTLAGNEVKNVLIGNGGNDTLYGRAGDDLLAGGAGADSLIGEDGKDFADYSFSTKGIKVSLDGSLIATGEAVGDTFSSIEGIAGSSGNDWLRGDSLDNELHGNNGDDKLEGGIGNDRLAGDYGKDTLTGGEGSDTFWYFFPTDGKDLITDFEDGDTIEFVSENFGISPLGAIAETLFQSAANHVAANADIRFLFDTTTNSLWFDSDGNGADKAVQLATFANAHQLLYTEIVIGELP